MKTKSSLKLLFTVKLTKSYNFYLTKNMTGKVIRVRHSLHHICVIYYIINSAYKIKLSTRRSQMDGSKINHALMSLLDITVSVSCKIVSFILPLGSL